MSRIPDLMGNSGAKLFGLFMAFAVTVTLGGCFVGEAIFGGGDDDTIVGLVAFGFEESAFRPCGSAEQWWVTGSEELVSLQNAYSALGLNWYEPALARLKGRSSSKGSFGHLGAYDREFEVNDVVEVRLLQEGECVWPAN